MFCGGFLLLRSKWDCERCGAFGPVGKLIQVGGIVAGMKE